MKSILFLVFFSSQVILSQIKFCNISGYVKNNLTKEPLANCNIYVNKLNLGTSSDNTGYYNLKLQADTYVITFSYVGYKTEERNVKLRSECDITLNVFLEEELYYEKEVTVIGEKETPSTIFQKIKSKDLQHIPTVFSDPIKSVQIFAGVSTNNELSSTYIVRGGSYAENLIYLNGYEIYRPFLLRSGAEENQSLINPDMTKSLSFFNGAFPANYGDKMSSALDVSYQKEQSHSLSGKIRADLMNGGITLAKKFNRLNIIGGFRYAYPDLFLNTLQTSGDYKLSYSDIQLLAEYKFLEKQTLEAFIIYADNNYNQQPKQWVGHIRTDRGAAINQVTIDYLGERNYSFNTNLVGLKYEHSFEDNILMSVAASRYETREIETTDLTGDIFFSPDAEFPDNGKELVKTRFEKNDNSISLISYTTSPKLTFKTQNNEFNLGAEIKYVEVTNKLGENLFEKTVNTIQQTPKHLNKIQAYLLNSYSLFSQNRLLLSDNWIVDFGLRYTHYKLTKENLVSPRFTISLLADTNQTFNFSWGYFYQPPFINELKYMSANKFDHLKSQLAVHYVFGWEYYFENDIKLTAEAYYKKLKHLYPFYFDNIKMIYLNEFTTEGNAFGFDVMFQGEIVNGIESWLGYSYLNSRERYSGSNKPYRRRLLDQTHTIQVFLQDRIPNHPNWKSHLKFLFGSGFLFNPRRIMTNDDGLSEFIVTFDKPEEYLIYLRVDMGLSAQFEIGANNLLITAEVLNIFNQYNIAGYDWIQLFSDYKQPIRIPQILSKRFFNLRAEWEF